MSEEHFEDNPDEELERLSPFLKKFKKDSGNKLPFEMPQNYFEAFEEDLFAQLKPETEQVAVSNKKVSAFWESLWQQVSYFLHPVRVVSLAGLVAIVILAVQLIQAPDTSLADFAGLSDASLEELDVYIDENLEEFDNDMILESLSTEEVQSLSEASMMLVVTDTLKPILDGVNPTEEKPEPPKDPENNNPSKDPTIEVDLNKLSKEELFEQMEKENLFDLIDSDELMEELEEAF